MEIVYLTLRAAELLRASAVPERVAMSESHETRSFFVLSMFWLLE